MKAAFIHPLPYSTKAYWTSSRRQVLKKRHQMLEKALRSQFFRIVQERCLLFKSLTRNFTISWKKDLEANPTKVEKFFLWPEIVLGASLASLTWAKMENNSIICGTILCLFIIVELPVSIEFSIHSSSIFLNLCWVERQCPGDIYRYFTKIRLHCQIEC